MKKILHFDLTEIVLIGVYFWKRDLLIATQAAMVVSIIHTITTFVLFRKCSFENLLKTALLIIFGLAAFIFKDSGLIVWKATATYGIFAIVILVSAYKKKYVVRWFLEKSGMESVKLQDEKVLCSLSVICGFLFLIMGIINQMVYAFTSEDIWFKYKSFVSPVFLLLFVLYSYFIIEKRYQKAQS